MKKFLCILLYSLLATGACVLAPLGAMPAWAAMSDSDFLKLCRKGSPQDIAAALKDGANPDARDKRQETPLMYAAAYNTLEAVKVLLDAGADVNAVNDKGDTLLLVALRNNHKPEVIEALRP